MKNILFLTLLSCSLYAQNGIKGIYSVSLSVQNLEQSAAFYQKAIGFTEGGRLPVQGPGITHICYQSSAENSIYKQAKINGATVVSRGTTPVNRGYGIQYAYIRDANNIMFETE